MSSVQANKQRTNCKNKQKFVCTGPAQRWRKLYEGNSKKSETIKMFTKTLLQYE